MRRFFVEPENISENRALITGGEARHITTVLRLEPGREITLLDGRGTMYRARIITTGKERVETLLLDSEKETMPGPTLHLGQGLAKGDKMDFIVQKATELGVAVIHPYISQHSVIRADESRKQKKNARWQKIALEACKQCNRSHPPTCMPIVDFESLVRASSEADLKLILWEGEESRSLGQALPTGKKPHSIMLLIGPEGGFSEQEVRRAAECGFLSVRLGRRVMRTETAALAATAIVQYLFGDLGG